MINIGKESETDKEVIMKKYNIGLSIFFTLLGLAIIYLSRDLKTAEQGFGAGTWPTFLAVFLIILSVILLVQTLIKMKLKTATTKSEEKKPIQFASAGMKRVYLIILVLVVYSLVQKWAGFYIACGVMIPLVLLVMGERRPLVLLAVTGGVIIVVFGLFGLVLHTPLPEGTLF